MDTSTPEFYTLSLHDALPICDPCRRRAAALRARFDRIFKRRTGYVMLDRLLARLDRRKRELLRVLERRSEEHTSELQSRQYLVCRLLLEKKKNETYMINGSRA